MTSFKGTIPDSHIFIHFHEDAYHVLLVVRANIIIFSYLQSSSVAISYQVR